MSQTCVMLTVLAQKPNPWRCSLQLAEQWPWSKFAHGHESGCSAAGSSKQRCMLPVICGARPIRTRENNRAISSRREPSPA